MTSSLPSPSRSSSHGRGRPAFTLVELLVVIGIIVVLISLLLPALNRAQESARKVKCASNLRQFGVAMLTYASSSNGQFPRTSFDSTAATQLVLNTSGRAPAGNATNPANPFAAGTIPPAAGDDAHTGQNNVPASIFLLVRAGLLTPEVLICPSAQTAGTATPDNFGGFDSPLKRCNFTDLSGVVGPTNLSYSMQVPFPLPQGAQSGFQWSNGDVDAQSPLAADMNPGPAGTDPNSADPATATYNMDTTTLKKYNSRNHRAARGLKDGQNVLYADGHVEWQETPYCGKKRSDLAPPNAATPVSWRDNIYTANPVAAQSEAGQTADRTSRPASVNDSILMPVADPTAVP